MSMVILRILLALGILGHGLNFYCDRILSIFPNGRLMLANMDELKKPGARFKVCSGFCFYSSSTLQKCSFVSLS